MTLSPAEKSELQDLERAVHQSEEFLFSLPDAVVEIDLDTWTVVSMNRMARILLRYDPATAPARISALDYVDDADREQAAAITVALAGESRANHTPYQRVARPATYEFTLKRMDGSTFPAEVTSSFVLDVDRIPIREYVLFRDITERRRIEAERTQLLSELQETVANLKTLRGLLPICAICKNVRDDDGYWIQIESYVRKHSDADFQHGLCESCRAEVYGDSHGKG